MASVREVTRRQVAALTVVSGATMDATFEDVTRYANAVPPRAVRRRMFRQTAVLGWMPPLPAATAYRAPWLPQRNDDTAASVTGAVPDLGITNADRVKGSYNPNVDQSDTTNQRVLAWTTAYLFTRPVVLDGFSLFLLADAAFPADITGVADELFDLGIVVSADDPFMPEIQSASSVLFQRVRFNTRAYPVSQIAIPGGWPDFFPAHPAGAPAGIGIDILGLNIPIPQNSRVRVAVMLPEYADPATNPWNNYDEDIYPEQGFVSSMSLHWLEAA